MIIDNNNNDMHNDNNCYKNNIVIIDNNNNMHNENNNYKNNYSNN